MKFQQLKLWPSRRVHLFQKGQPLSFCGIGWRGAGDPVGSIDWEKEAATLHPYDDLNFCQSCRRKAMSWHDQKYQPLTEKYDHLRQAFENRQRKVKK